MTHPVWTTTQVIDQLDTGYHWNGQGLTYAFPSNASWFSNGEQSGASALTAAQQAVATLAIRLWDDLIGPDFTLTTNTASADVQYMNTTTSISYAHAYFPSSSSSGGSVWFNSQYGSNSGTNNLMTPVAGQWGWMTFIHETGHALGLNHPGEYNGGSPTYANDALFAQDSQMYTLMSYFTASNTGADWIADDGRTYYAQTPMLYDVMTIQSMYGAETTTRTGNTVYGFNSNADFSLFDFSQNRHPVLCIYDSAGNDTIDLSGWNYSCTLNLTPGSFSSCDMMTYNISIAYSAVIENGIGGGGNDSLTGNDLGNLLSGLAGDDTISGGGGNDTINGGAGNDLIFGATGSDVVDAGDGNNTIVGGQDSADGADVITAGSGNDLIFGNGGDDTLSGGGGQNVLVGGVGNDSISAGAGNDIVFGNQGNDIIDAGSGANLIFGGFGDDVIITGAGNDTIWGNEGNDTLIGGAGADRYIFAAGSAADLIRGFSAAEGDRLDLQGETYTLSSAANGDAVLTLSGGGTITLAGIVTTQVTAGLFV